MEDVKFTIIEKYGVISSESNGWQKEINLISWNGAAPKFDIRKWAPDHKKMGKGISLSEEEARSLCNILIGLVE